MALNEWMKVSVQGNGKTLSATLLQSVRARLREK